MRQWPEIHILQSRRHPEYIPILAARHIVGCTCGTLAGCNCSLPANHYILCDTCRMKVIA